METDAVATVVAGVATVTDDGGPEVSTVGTAEVEDENVEIGVQHADKETVAAGDGDDPVLVLAAVVSVALCAPAVV